MTAESYLADLPRGRKQAFPAIERCILATLKAPTPKELCVTFGYKPQEKAVIRFRKFLLEYVLEELPKLEQSGRLTHEQMLPVMQSISTSSSRWPADREVMKVRLRWFCDYLLNHTTTALTNLEINRIAFGRDEKDLGSPNYTPVIREFRERELADVLRRLLALPVAEIVDGPSKTAETLLSRLERLWVPKLRVPPSIDAAPLMRAVCDYIVESRSIVPTYNGLREILAFIPSSNVKGHGFMGILKQWRNDRGFPEALRGNMNPALPRTWGMLIPTLGRPVRRAPHTFLDPRAKPGRYLRPDDEVAAQLGRCKDPDIRSALVLAVLNACGNHDTLPMFAAGLKQIMEAGRLRSLTDPRMEDTLRAFVTGDLVLEEGPDDTGDDEDDEERDSDEETDEDDEQSQRWSKNKLRDFFRVYRAVSYAQQRYLNELPKKERKHFTSYLLPRLQDQVFWKAKNFNYIVEAAARRRRKARTDALFPHRGLIRTLPEFRTNQATRILTAFRIEVAKLDEGSTSPPVDFTVYEDEPHLGTPVRHSFRLWSQEALWDKYRPSVQRRFRDGTSRLFVEYLGAIDDAGKTSTNELWFADLLRFNACHRGLLRDDKTAALLASYGIPASGYQSLWAMLCASRKLSLSLATLIAECRQTDSSFRPIYFSPEGLHQVCLFGRVANRVLNITGCRANELQQMHASAECLLKIPLERRAAAFAFMAIPKLSHDLEPFFIDETCVKFIGELATCIAKTSPSGMMPKVVGATNLARHKRQAPKPYLFQRLRHPRAMRAGLIGSMVRFMLHGLMFTTVDGKRFQPGLHDIRHLIGATLRNQGIPVEVIAKMFKQKDYRVTDYYSEATSSMVVAAMHGLQMAVIGVGPVAGVRRADELKQQLKDADGVVGALSRVLGGPCVVASPCAVKFACLGCAGLVPDPAERHHVERNKVRLQEDLAEHIKHGMLAEVRKDQQHIADCDRVLAEMALQEAAIDDAEKNGRCSKEAQ